MICFVVFYQFTQQNLPACKPVLTPSWVSNSDIFCSSLLPPPPPPTQKKFYYCSLLYFVMLTFADCYYIFIDGCHFHSHWACHSSYFSQCNSLYALFI